MALVAPPSQIATSVWRDATMLSSSPISSTTGQILPSLPCLPNHTKLEYIQITIINQDRVDGSTLQHVTGDMQGEDIVFEMDDRPPGLSRLAIWSHIPWQTWMHLLRRLKTYRVWMHP